MIKELKTLRSGNIRISNNPINMNTPKEIIHPLNVFQNKHTLGVNVKRYFTDTNGVIVPKTNPALIAAGMVVNYPVFTLGQFDKESGYKVGQNILPPLGASKYLLTFVNGFGYTSHNVVTPFSGLNQIQGLLMLGDVVSVYVDNLNAPNYFCFMVVSSNITGYNSILANLSSRQNDNRLMRLFCRKITLITNVNAQLNEVWHYTHVDNLGNYKDNQISYSMFINPYQVSPESIDIETEFTFNQYIGIYFYMSIDVDIIGINYRFELVE